MKAACSALKPEVSGGLAVCKEFTRGHCAPGSIGDRTCGSTGNAGINRSICKEVDEAENGEGYQCASLINISVAL